MFLICTQVHMVIKQVQLCITYMYVHAGTSAHIFAPALPMERAQDSDTPVANEHIQCPDLGFQILFSTQRNQDSLEKFLIPQLGSKTSKLAWHISLCRTGRMCSKNDGDMSTRHRSQPERGSHWKNQGTLGMKINSSSGL